MVVAASTQTSVGLVILLVAFAVGAIYAFINIRQSKPEVGSEIELAPNRRLYLADEELEGRKLDRTLSLGLLGLFVVGIGLPMYWLQEPSRQSNEEGNIARKFVERGAEAFATTEDGGFNCAFCHGAEGVGGVAPYTITDAEGRFVKQVDWQGPALNTVLLRYTRDEVRYILEYGRPFSPMPAWGSKGGGPLTEQSLQNLIDYMDSFQIDPETAQQAATEQLTKMMAEPDEACATAEVEAAKEGLSEAELEDFDEATVSTTSCARKWKSQGEALFNMGYDDGFAGGAYSCGRCHTQGWSYGDKEADGNGAMGPNLRGVTGQFPGGSLGLEQQTDFVCTGSSEGVQYGRHGQGTGRMPGFCITPDVKPNLENREVGIDAVDAGVPEDGAMLTEDQVRAVVEYERSLSQ